MAGESNISDILENFPSLDISGNAFLDTKLLGEVTIGNLIACAIIIVIVLIISRIVSGAIRRVLIGKAEVNSINFITKLVRWVIYFIGFLVLSPQLHLDLSGLLVAGGVVAVAFGFASQNTLSNFVAGVLLMFERPITIGDNISVKGTEGYVEDIGLLSTKIRTYEGIYVRIPNDTLFTSDITNYVSNVARRFDYSVDISYSEDADKAIKIIKKVIDTHPYALKSPSPSVYVNELGASGISIKVRIWSPSGYWWDARVDLLWKIFKALKTANVDIPFDQLVIWFGQEEAEKLKAEKLKTKETVSEIMSKAETAPENTRKQVK
ncbi:MAG: mechanosensitive ion channel family protein [Methanocorpusculum sp.]|nr:mechanosensitive ion channel family protein [Methanocorpusculum sp.]